MIQMCGVVAFLAFTFFVTVDGDSRSRFDRCHFSPHGVRVPWNPSEEGDFNVKFYVPHRRWGTEEDDLPLTLGFEWTGTEQTNPFRKGRYSLEPPRAGPRSPTNATRLPNEPLLVGLNRLNLTWHNATSGNVSTLNIGNFTTEVNIVPGDEVNVTVEGMTSFLNCDFGGGGWRRYLFNSSSLWSHKILHFNWEQKGSQTIKIRNPSFVSLSTHPGGRKVTICRKIPYSSNWNLRRGCPPGIWGEYKEGDGVGFRGDHHIDIYGFSVDLREGEDYWVVKGNVSFIQLEVNFTGGERDSAEIDTLHQIELNVTYEELFPSEDIENTAIPITTPTPECPVTSVVDPFCPPGAPFNHSLFIQKLKEREEELRSATRRIEELSSGYINYEELCIPGSEEAPHLGARTPLPLLPTENQQPTAPTSYSESPPSDEDRKTGTRDPEGEKTGL